MGILREGLRSDSGPTPVRYERGMVAGSVSAAEDAREAAAALIREYAAALEAAASDWECPDIQFTVDPVDWKRGVIASVVNEAIKSYLDDESDHPKWDDTRLLNTTHSVGLVDGSTSQVYAAVFTSNGGEKCAALFVMVGKAVEVQIISGE